MDITKIARFTSPFRSRLIIKAYKPWIKKRDKVLDIGCGTGIAGLAIGEVFEAEVTGCDVKNYLSVMMPFFRIPKNGKLPFSGKVFDVATINDVLHHVEKKKQLEIINEGLRVANTLLIFEVEPTIMGKLFDVVLNNIHYKGLDTPLAFRTINEWSDLFDKNGYGYSIKTVIAPWWYPFSHIAIRLKAREN